MQMYQESRRGLGGRPLAETGDKAFRAGVAHSREWRLSF